MTIERNVEFAASPRMPKDVYEQLDRLPCDEERGEICMELAQKIYSLLSNNHIVVDNITMRVKSEARMNSKIERRGSTAPLRDIYGIRIITEYPDRAKIAAIVQSAFPLTPEKFEDGMPSVREYANPETRQFVKSNFNPRISERHSAMHINIVFRGKDLTIMASPTELLDIAEVQVLNEEEMRIFKETRGEYENGKH